ncbi:hypothetical protein AMATHDRAFT_134865 [Amanita thiersii Skay4041]|uniref:LIM zinc-binding domain-containing protein n=1 Tax=Amanita thiersii Skay4041 TaxID=703135 RepID=A0A2A9NYD7_9AGAR|nr:hypothetical protein AMATHDRAFT_134865 [Amanita thiersii Skay4041]
MGFCRRCGDIVTGERCKCGGIAVAPAVNWKDTEHDQDKWTRTYISRDRSTSVSSAPVKQNSKHTLNYSSTDLPSRVSEHIAATTSSRSASPLKPSITGPAPEADILPSPCDNSLSKVYGSVLQPQESLATFSCTICNIVFPPDATIYPDPRSTSAASDGRFLCRPCFVNNGGSKGTCPACSRPVLTLKSEGGFIQAMDNYWHKICFNCNKCHKNIGDSPLVDLLGRPSCLECFESCLRRDHTVEPSKTQCYSPLNSRNLGGMDLANLNSISKSREASPALDELEQRIGISKNTREGSPSLEELSQRLSSIGKEFSRPRRDSRPSERFKSPEPDFGTPERIQVTRYSTGSPVSLRRQITDSSSPAPNQEAIEEMKQRFMRGSISSIASPGSPSNNQRKSTVPSNPNSPLHTSRQITSHRTSSSSRIPPPVPMTPDLMSDTSDATTQSIFSGISQSPLFHIRETIPKSSSNELYANKYSEYENSEIDDVIVEETESQLTTPVNTPSKKLYTPPMKISSLSKIPVASQLASVCMRPPDPAPMATVENEELSSPIRCSQCAGLLFSVKGGGKCVTLPAEDGGRSTSYHVECLRCSICGDVFKETGNGQAIFVKAKGGPCHVECAPADIHTILVSGNSINPSTSETASVARKTDISSAYSSSRYERPLVSNFSTIALASSSSSSRVAVAGSLPRFGSRTTCPGCNVSVSPMERGVVPGPQGTRWHAACLICGGRDAEVQKEKERGSLWMIGRGAGGGPKEKRRKGEPGCGKKLDSAAKTDGDGGVWCRECLLLLGSSSPTKVLVPSHTGSTTKGVVAQNTGTTTIAKQFTGFGNGGEIGKESGLLRQLTGGGLSPTRSISPTKQMGGGFGSSSTTNGRPRPKSVIGIRSTKSVDEGRGMFLVRQMTGSQEECEKR